MTIFKKTLHYTSYRTALHKNQTKYLGKITKWNKHFVVIWDSWIALPRKYMKLNICQWIKMIMLDAHGDDCVPWQGADTVRRPSQSSCRQPRKWRTIPRWVESSNNLISTCFFLINVQFYAKLSVYIIVFMFCIGWCFVSSSVVSSLPDFTNICDFRFYADFVFQSLYIWFTRYIRFWKFTIIIHLNVWHLRYMF